MNPVKICYSIVANILNFAILVTSLVVGFMYLPCDNKQMSTWLLVNGFMVIVIWMVLISMLINTMACMVISDGFSAAACCGSLVFLVTLAFHGFMLGWIIYGAVLFFPKAGGPYPTCPDDQDGQVLVTTGITMVALRLACLVIGMVKRAVCRDDEEDSPTCTFSV